MGGSTTTITCSDAANRRRGLWLRHQSLLLHRRFLPDLLHARGGREGVEARNPATGSGRGIIVLTRRRRGRPRDLGTDESETRNRSWAVPTGGSHRRDPMPHDFPFCAFVCLVPLAGCALAEPGPGARRPWAAMVRSSPPRPAADPRLASTRPPADPRRRRVAARGAPRRSAGPPGMHLAVSRAPLARLRLVTRAAATQAWRPIRVLRALRSHASCSAGFLPTSASAHCPGTATG